MKKLVLIAFSLIILVTLGFLISAPSRATISKGNETYPIAFSIPDSVSDILDKSCGACHSEPGKGMALSKLNFDKWETYKPERQAGKAGDICDEVTKGGMPPKSFKANNPDKVPTQAEAEIICKWAESFPKK